MSVNRKPAGNRLWLLGMQIAKRLRAVFRTASSAATDPFVLIKNSFDLIIVLQPDMKFRYVSPSVARILGYKAEDLLRGNALDYIHQEDASYFQDKFAELIRQPSVSATINLRVRHANGSWIEFEVVAKNLFQETTVQGLVLNCRDMTEHQRMEEELRLLADAVKMSTDSILITDPEGSILDANEAALKMHGLSNKSDLVGVNALSFTSAKGREDVLRTSLKVREEGRLNEPIQSDIVTKSGKILTIEFTASVMKGKNGETTGFVSVARDVTERKRMEEELRRSEEKFRQFFENAAVYCYMISTDAKILDVNRLALEALGYTREELLGKPLATIYATESRQKMKGLFERWKEKGKIDSEEMTIITKRGERRTVLLSTDAVRDKDGNILHSVSVQKDITERKRMEEALRSSEERYRELFENANDVIYTHDLAGNFTSVNKAGERVIGYMRDELLGMNLSRILSPGSLEKAQQMIARKVRQGGRTQYELEVITKDKHKVLLEVSSRLIYEGDKPTGIQGIARDVTERKKMEQELILLSNAVKMSTESIVVIDLEGRVIDANEATFKMQGVEYREKQKIIGLKILNEQIVPEEREKAAADLAKVMEKGTVEGLQYHFSTLDGRRILVEISASLMRDEKGEPTGIVAISRDITERERMEEELRKSEQKFRNIFNNAQVGLFRSRIADGKLLECNDLLAKTFGYEDREECIARHVTAEHYVDVKVRNQQLAQMVANGKVENFETMVTRKDGSPFWISYSATVYPERNYIEGVVVDITERKKMEETLRDSEERYRALVEAAGEAGGGILLSQDLEDNQGAIVFANDEYCRMTGYSKEELLNMTVWDLASTNVVHKAKEMYIRRNAREGASVYWDGMLKRKEGVLVPVEIFVGKMIYRGQEAYVFYIRDISERKRMVEALRISERQYRLLAENIKDIIWTTDMNLRFTYLSPSVTQLTGYSFEEYKVKNLDEIMPSASFEAVKNVWAEELTLEAGEHKDLLRAPVFEVELRRKDLSLVPVEIKASFLRDSDGRAIGILGVTRDITERKKAEEELRESELKHRTLIETAAKAGLGIAMIQNREDGEAAFVFVNDEYCFMSGYSREELLGMPIQDLMAAEDRDMVMERHRKRQRGEAVPSTYEAGLLRKDRSSISVEASVTSYEYRGKLATVVFCRDITERKRMEKALRESEERYRDLFENANDIIFVYSLEGDLIAINKAAEQVTGYTREEMKKMSTESILAPEYVRAAREVVERIVWGRGPECYEHEVIARDGHRVQLESSVKLVYEGGKAVAVQGISRDITQRKKMEQQLLRLSNAVEASTDSIIIIDLEGNLLNMNEATLKLHGAKSKEEAFARIKQLKGLLVPIDREKALINFAELVEKGSLEGVQYHVSTLDGREILIEVNASLMRSENGEPIGIVAVSRDITERKRMEEEIKQSEEKLRLITDNVQDLIAQIDVEGRCRYLSPSYKTMLGYEPKEHLGESFFEFTRNVHPDDRDKLESDLNLTLSAALPGRIQYRFKHTDGRYLWLESQWSMLYDDAGQTKGIVVVTRDISERKNMEEELHLLSDAVKMSTDSILITDLEGNILDANEATVKMHDVSSKSDLIGMNALSFTSVKGREDALRTSLKVLGEGRLNELIQSELVTRSGKILTLEFTASVMRGKNGEPTGFVSVARDITERKKMEETLRESEERFRRLAECAPDIIFRWSVEKGLEYVSPVVATITGYTPEELKLDPFIVLKLAGFFDNQVLEDYKRVIEESRSEYIREFSVPRKDGKQAHLDLRANALKDNEGRIVAFEGVVRDVTDQKLAEEALKRSERNYRVLFESKTDALVVVDAATLRIVLANQSAADMFGFNSPKDIIGVDVLDIVYPEDREMTLKRLREGVFGADLNNTTEARYISKDGKVIWTNVMGAMTEYQGRMAYLASIRDITEHKKAENALRESEERYRALVNTAGLAGEGIMILERAEGNKSVISFVNDALSAMLGYQIKEMIGMPAWNLFAPGDRVLLRNKDKRRHKRGELPSHYAVMALRKDGSMLPIEISMGAMKYRGEDETVVYVRDITERKQAEKALRESEAQFRAIFDGAAIGVRLVDKNGQTLKINPAFEHMLGYTLEELRSMPPPACVHHDDAQIDKELFAEMIAGKRDHYEVDKRFIRKDGKVVWGRVTRSAVWDASRKFQFAISMTEDVTEQVKAHEELLGHMKRVEVLHAIAQQASQTLNLEELLNMSLEKLVGVMGADAGGIYLLDELENELVLKAHKGISGEAILKIATIKLSAENAENMMHQGDETLQFLPRSDEARSVILEEVREHEQIQSFAFVPFAIRGQLSGLIAVGNRSPRKFSSADMDLLRAVGNQIGISTQNSILYEEVRALIRETIDAQEKARERICLEVHDGVAQTLVSAFQYLQALEATEPENRQTKQLLDKATAQVKQAIQESREVINSLQPATLTDLGLIATLRHELKRLGKETRMRIDFRADDIRLPKDVEVGLYWIIREAIFNAKKHADTKRLRVKINLENNRVKVEVKDWGKGFNQAYLNGTRMRGTGLFSIRKRAELLDGTCEIESKLGEGTTVYVDIPFVDAKQPV